jgi:hypothetical protein
MPLTHGDEDSASRRRALHSLQAQFDSGGSAPTALFPRLFVSIMARRMDCLAFRDLSRTQREHARRAKVDGRHEARNGGAEKRIP